MTIRAHPHTFILCVLVLLGVNSPAYAQTPDGMPPANERICDPLKSGGVTRSLYGLCVAYCEALDCDLQQVPPGNVTPQCKAPTSKILQRYNAHKSPTDPPMPCVQQQACPCWTAQEVGAIGFTFSPNLVDFFPNDFSPSYIRYTLVENRDSVYGAYQYADVFYFPAQQPAAQCVYAYYDSLDPAKYVVRSQEISLQQADAGKAQITQQVNNLGGTGVPVKCSGNLCP